MFFLLVIFAFRTSTGEYWVSCTVVSRRYHLLMFTAYSIQHRVGEQWWVGDISPPHPAAALIGLLSPRNCPSSMTTTSSLTSQPPLPVLWWPSVGSPQSYQQQRKVRIVDLTTKHLHPTSTGWMVALQPTFIALCCQFLRTWAAWTHVLVVSPPLKGK